VVVLRLGELAHAVDEVERLAEVLERERPLERPVDLAPGIRLGHAASIYDRAPTMTVSTDDPAPRALEGRKDRPALEIAVAYGFGPLSDRLAHALLLSRVSPVAVVLANVAAGVAGAAAIQQDVLVLAAVLLQLKTLLDNTDGRLARVSGRVSLLGRYLDTEADLVVNALVLAALGATADTPWLAGAAFCALIAVLSTSFNFGEVHREVYGRPALLHRRSGGVVERALEGLYRAVFAPQDRLLRALWARRLERILRHEADSERRRDATLAYYDAGTAAVLANLGLSTQLLALGVCLVAGAPSFYLWLVVGSAALLPLLQLRRERLARRALRPRRGA
jgi:archaetidylinositol phosphate synthase